MSESGNEQRQLETPVIEAGKPEPEASLDDKTGGASPGTMEEESLDTELGIDPIQRLLSRRYPRIALHRDTLRLLQRVEWMNRNQGINDFCNDALRYLILSRESGTVTFNDLHAVSAALDSRLDELNAILLHLHQAAGDLSLIVEHQRFIGAYGERLKQATVNARQK